MISTRVAVITVITSHTLLLGYVLSIAQTYHAVNSAIIYFLCVSSLVYIFGESPGCELMGNIMTNANNNDDDSSLCSDDEVDLSFMRNKPVADPRLDLRRIKMDMQVDAVTTATKRPFPHLSHIENDLSEYEKISLIYLLNNDAQVCLEAMGRTLTDNVLPNTLILNQHGFRDFIIEGLCVIQNYEVLKKHFGISKEELLPHYLPLQRCTSVHINTLKKCLFRTFEDMASWKQVTFLKVIEKDFRERNLDFKEFPYLEMYFAYFETIDYISRDNFSAIEKALMVVGMEMYYEDLQRLSKQSCCEGRRINLDKVRNNSLGPTDAPDSSLEFRTGGQSNSEGPDPPYPMNPDSPGICLIIDNKFFYTEPDDKLKDQVISNLSNAKVGDRHGTEYDSQRLEDTFKKFKFDIILKKNMTHEEILTAIRDVAHRKVEEDHSTLIICLLSHGEKGKVIGSNSIPVTIADIKQQLHSANLKGKPKVLIIQSCQGERVQTLTTDSPQNECELTTDAPVMVTPANDFLEIWSTVPGYASIRDPTSGTWFIQSLCDMINQYPTRNLVEICTYVKNKVHKRRWKYDKDGVKETRVMTCLTTDTLDRLLYLPPIKSE